MRGDWFRQDLGYALRTLRGSPTFALTAILTLALGIGANTAIFSLVRAVLLKPLAYTEPQQLVRLTGGATDARFESLEAARSFTGVGAFTVFGDRVTISGQDEPEPVKGARVSTNLLEVLGVTPQLGRSFRPEDKRVGSHVLLLSAALWQRRFRGDAGVLGMRVTLATGEGAEAYTIIGVLPAGLTLPFPQPDLLRPWQPEALPEGVRRNSPLLSVVGRLRPGVTATQANAELAVLQRQYAASHQGALDARAENQREAVQPLQSFLVRDVASILWLLLGAVSFLLLMACANVASLTLARSASRRGEFAVRAALGASPGRLWWTQLSESLVLSLAGGAVAVVLAGASLRWLASLPGLELPRSEEVQLDAVVLAFALGVALLTALLFGLSPLVGQMLARSQPDLAGVMRASGEAASLTRHGRLLFAPRGLLVVGQIALSVVLLIGAALMMESLASLRRVQPGFEPHGLLTMEITLPQARHEELVRRVESIPGVRSAAVTLTLPTTGFAGTPVQAADQPLLKLNERPIATLQTVTPAYFETLGIAIREGHAFTGADRADTPLVAVINESLARRLWPSGAALGRSLLVGTNPKPVRVTAVVADVKQGGLGDEVQPGLYRPRSQTPELPAMFAVRTTGDPLSVVGAIRHEMRQMDRHQAIAAVRTMESVLAESEGQRSSILLCFGLFAGTGLLLMIVGLYGVMAYSVTRRGRELGIRQALGAQTWDIFRLVLSQGMGLAFAGMALGLAGAFALTRLMRSLLFGVSPTDPATFASVAGVVLLVAIAASYLPARRALRETLPNSR